MHGYITSGDLTIRGAATGSWMDGLLSLLIGSAFLWVPRFGPLLVVGWLGALANWGIAEEYILDYEQQVPGGKHLVIAYGTDEEVERAYVIR